MKRSRRVGILIASASLMALAGCYEEEAKVTVHGPAPSQIEAPADQKVFANLEACLADAPSGTPETDQFRLKCIADWEAAKEAHAKQAPRFASLAECQAEFGPEGCGAAPAAAAAPGATASGGDSGNFFMPLLMGYMIGNALSSPAPAYYDRNGGYRSYGSGSSATNRLKSSSVFVSPRGTALDARSTTTRPAAAPAPAAPKTMSTSTRSRSSGFGSSRSGGFGG